MTTVELPLIDDGEVFAPTRFTVSTRPTITLSLIDDSEVFGPSSISGPTALTLPLIDDDGA